MQAVAMCIHSYDGWEAFDFEVPHCFWNTHLLEEVDTFDVFDRSLPSSIIHRSFAAHQRNGLHTVA